MGPKPSKAQLRRSRKSSHTGPPPASARSRRQTLDGKSRLCGNQSVSCVFGHPIFLTHFFSFECSARVPRPRSEWKTVDKRRQVTALGLTKKVLGLLFRPKILYILWFPILFRFLPFARTVCKRTKLNRGIFHNLLLSWCSRYSAVASIVAKRESTLGGRARRTMCLYVT